MKNGRILSIAAQMAVLSLTVLGALMGGLVARSAIARFLGPITMGLRNSPMADLDPVIRFCDALGHCLRGPNFSVLGDKVWTICSDLSGWVRMVAGVFLKKIREGWCEGPDSNRRTSAGTDLESVAFNRAWLPSHWKRAKALVL